MKRLLSLARNKQVTCILLYHHIGYTKTDVWNLSVTPENFESHLQVICEEADVISIAALANENPPGRKAKVVVTFDDGYEDNYTIARPLLEKYDLPASFFIATEHIDTPKLYWWDELEYILLQGDLLAGPHFINLADGEYEFAVGEEATLSEALATRHSGWSAMDAPVSLRTAMYLLLWEKMRSMPYAEQQQALRQLRTWMAGPAGIPTSYKCMSRKQVQSLSESKLFTIGSHTCTHPYLSALPFNLQEKELKESKDQLGLMINQPVNLLAYPYGNYNEDSVRAAVSSGYSAAFTTESLNFQTGKDMYRIGRHVAEDMSADQFRKMLKRWMKA